MSLKPSIYWLFAFIPITLALEYAAVTPPAVFFSAALAIIPIASLIAQSTEQIATRTGDAVGGLLNASFGNLPELIIATVALKAGLFDMVRASLVGAILANLLLALGVAFFLGGLLGAGAGVAIIKAVAGFFPSGLPIQVGGLLAAIGISLALGIVYGIYPALKASRLEPVEALRSAA